MDFVQIATWRTRNMKDKSDNFQNSAGKKTSDRHSEMTERYFESLT